MDSLAVKHRPETFQDVYGQDLITNALEYAIRTNNVHKSYLFSGPSGVGKTTVARVFAYELNNGLNGVIEIDGASNNGVDNVRDIIETAQFKPIGSKYRIFLIDEVHMLTPQAFNALLKILEEAPEHVIFILCTTDPNKIPATVLSRLERFDFRRVPVSVIVDKLLYIITIEDIEISEEILYFIATNADGSLREAINSLSKIMNYVEGYFLTETYESLTLDKIYGLFGTLDYIAYSNLSEAIKNLDVVLFINLFEHIYSTGVNLKTFINDYINYCVDMGIYMATKKYENTKLRTAKATLDFWSGDLNNYNLFLTILDSLLNLRETTKYESNIYSLVLAEFLLLIGEKYDRSK